MFSSDGVDTTTSGYLAFEGDYLLDDFQECQIGSQVRERMAFVFNEAFKKT
jgi:hypothetical protein